MTRLSRRFCMPFVRSTARESAGSSGHVIVLLCLKEGMSDLDTRFVFLKQFDLVPDLSHFVPIFAPNSFISV